MSPVQDITSSLKAELAFSASVTSNTTTFGSAIDTADFDLGLNLDVALQNFTDGSYAFSLEQDDNSSFTSPTAVEADKIIGSLPTLTAETAEGDALSSFGAIDTEQFVRVVVVSTGVTTGSDVTAVSNKKAELSPAT